MIGTMILGQLAGAALVGALVVGAAHPTHVMRGLPAAAAPDSIGKHRIFGHFVGMSGQLIKLLARNGKTILVDGSNAATSVVLTPDRPIIVTGSTTPDGVLHAISIWRTFDDQAHWPNDE